MTDWRSKVKWIILIVVLLFLGNYLIIEYVIPWIKSRTRKKIDGNEN